MIKGEQAKNLEEISRVVKAMESADTEQRLCGLQGSIRELEKHALDRHARFITIVFSCMTVFVATCAILVTVLGWLSKTETREATKEMESKTERAITEMNARFEKLAGESLRKPLLQILTQSGPLDGHVFDVTNLSPFVQIGPLFLKNVGNKRSDSLSVRFYASENVNFLSGYWESVASNDRDYKYSWYAGGGRNVSIDATETWSMESLIFQLYGPATNINAKLMVYYGAENPAEADFVMRFNTK